MFVLPLQCLVWRVSGPGGRDDRSASGMARDHQLWLSRTPQSILKPSLIPSCSRGSRFVPRLPRRRCKLSGARDFVRPLKGARGSVHARIARVAAQTTESGNNGLGLDSPVVGPLVPLLLCRGEWRFQKQKKPSGIRPLDHLPRACTTTP